MTPHHSYNQIFYTVKPLRVTASIAQVMFGEKRLRLERGMERRSPDSRPHTPPNELLFLFESIGLSDCKK